MDDLSAKRTVANPSIVLREEFDNWAILFDPDTGNTFGLNPIGVLIWKHLDGRRTIGEIIDQIREEAENVSPDVASHVSEFISNVSRLGLVRNIEPQG
jgi:SynChlorMet cassette protein ScmD